MKAKKLMLALLGAALLTSLVATPALADPPTRVLNNPPKWTGGHRAQVTDLLIPALGSPEPTASGYVRFACQSKQGFEYSIGVKGLTGGTYTVWANPLPLAYPPGMPPTPTSDAGSPPYWLGVINPSADGDGEIDDGLVPLPATHPFSLPFGLYNWQIVVKNSGGTVVLEITPGDEAEFVVFP